MTTTTVVALLASVPSEHLLDGAEVCAKEDKVAFGSRAWEVFKKLDEIRAGDAVDVYIYASHSVQQSGIPEVGWHARYIGHMEGIGGAHPDGMRYRPPPTAMYPDDNIGHWAVFWEVESLRRVEPTERICIRDLRGLDKAKGYASDFVPEGPLLIEHP